MRVLVIGAGPAGTRCAELLAQAGARVTLCGEEPGLPYDRVALGRVLSGQAEARALVTHDAARLRDLGIRFRAGTRIVALDPRARRARTAQGETIGFDRAVLALGSEPLRLPLPGADLPGVFAYRTLDDALGMRRHLAPGMRAAVIGGGLLGLEAAAALAASGARVAVVHAAAWPMERQLDDGAGVLLARDLAARHGLAFRMPAATAAIEGDNRVQALRLADGTRLPAEMVVMAVGVRPQVALARAAGIAVGRGVLVDEAMRTSAADVLAIGECAEHRGAVCGLVAPALAMAEAAAATLAGQPARYAPRPAPAALKVAGLAVWSAGEIAPADAEAITLSDAAFGRYRRLWLRQGRLVGAVLYGDDADAPFFQELIASGRDVAAQRASLPFGPACLDAA